MEIDKKKVGLFLPIPLADALDQMTSRVGKKQKWLIVSAALIRLMQSDEQTQNDLIRQVKIADLPGGSFEQLIKTASASHARSAAAESTDRAADFQQIVAIDDSAQSQPNAVESANRWPRASHAGTPTRPRDKSKSTRRSGPN